jgi:hypothetical protein
MGLKTSAEIVHLRRPFSFRFTLSTVTCGDTSIGACGDASIGACEARQLLLVDLGP